MKALTTYAGLELSANHVMARQVFLTLSLTTEPLTPASAEYEKQAIRLAGK